jgi:putative tricarboxylic transport membrane protein
MVAVLTTIGLVLAYILFARQIGFIPMMVGILVIMFWLLRVPLWQTLPIAIVAALVIDYVFRSLLLVPLPFGIMPRLPW